MAELKNPQEPTFPSKRKTDDPNPQDSPIKAPKLATVDNINDDQEPNPNSKNHTEFSEPGNDVVQEEAGNGGNELQIDAVADKEEEEEEDDDDDDDEDDEENSNVEAEVDRKGKGVLHDDKGKGKLIEEEDDDDDEDDEDDDSDDDDDSDEDGNVSGADSDFSDDPLAEVDLNNILPSRTRRRTVQPGLHIAGDAGNLPADDDDDDDSDA